MDLCTRFYCMFMTVSMVTGFIYNNSIPGLRFGVVSTFLNTTGPVHHMEVDGLFPDLIIYSSMNVLSSTSYGLIVAIASGREDFDSQITGFVQLQDPNKILMVDRLFHCIRLLDRRFKNVSNPYGTCGSHGYADAYNQDARFNTPLEIVRSPFHVNTVYVLSSGYNSRIRFINISTGEVGTKSLPAIPRPTNLAFGSVPIIFGGNKAIYATDDFEVPPTLISGTEAGLSSYRDGRLQTAQYYNLQDIISIEDGVYIAADHSKLRVIDTVRDLVYSVCTVGYPPADGPITSCHLRSPVSLLLNGSDMFIGDYYGGIKRVFIRSADYKTTTPLFTGTTEIRPLITEQIFPLYGPVAGGTLVQIMLNNEDQFIVNKSLTSITIYRQPVEFNISSSQRTLTLTTLRYHTDYSTVKLQVKILEKIDGKVISRNLEENFEYKPNPVLDFVYARRSILSGGTNITIAGKFMDSVLSPVMIVYLRQNEEIIMEYTSHCLVISGLESVCKAPDVKEEVEKLLVSQDNWALIGDGKPASNRNNVTFTLGFTFDGLHEYIDLTKIPRLSHLAALDMYRDPKIKSFVEEGLDEVLSFNGNQNEVLRITGEYLDVDGTANDEYHIEIGDGGICRVKSIDSNLITCNPPAESPEADEANFRLYKRRKTPHIQVSIGNVHSSVGYIYYETNFWVDNEWIRITTYTMCVVLFLLILAVIIFKVWRRNKVPRRKKLPARVMTISEMAKIRNHDVTKEEAPNEYPESMTIPLVSAEYKKKDVVISFLGKTIDIEIQSKINNCKIDKERLRLGDRVGKGNFGEVYRGQLLTSAGKYRKVAVKTIRDDTDIDFNVFENLLKEATIMLDFRHENVLALIGVVCEEEKRPLVILPYMEHRDLHHLISDDSFDLVLGDIVQFGHQIAQGMSYLSKERFVHRDLAARNCMVDSKYVVKIADFGMSRDVYDRDYYVMENRQKPLPMRWMAIESLKEGRYTSMSDVWSFGVTMWELLTRGGLPYPGIHNTYIKKYICSGEKLDKPDTCPAVIYEVLLRCWENQPDGRPNFPEICVFLDNLLKNDGQSNGSSEEYSYVRKMTNQLSADYVKSSDDYIESESYLSPLGAGYCGPSNAYYI